MNLCECYFGTLHPLPSTFPHFTAWNKQHGSSCCSRWKSNKVCGRTNLEHKHHYHDDTKNKQQKLTMCRSSLPSCSDFFCTSTGVWLIKKKKERHHQGAQLNAAFERCDTSYMFPTHLCLWQALEVQRRLRSEECVRGPGSHVPSWMIHRVVYARNWLVERKKNVMIRGETLRRSSPAGLKELNAPSERLDPANDCRVQHSMLQSHFL